MIRQFTIGRNPNNNIVIPNPTVSGYHGDLIVDDSSGFSQYTFIDHSTNGTLINGQLLRNASCFVIYNDSILLAGNVPFDWRNLDYTNNNTISNFAPQPVNSVERNGGGISFGGALKSFFHNYVNFSGRATRREFWFVFLWLIIFQTALSLLLFPLAISSIGGIVEFYDYPVHALLGLGWYMLIWSIYGLALFLPQLSLLVRRIHDTGRDGLWILMLLVPLANIVFFFIWTLSPSENKPNKWGR